MQPHTTATRTPTEAGALTAARGSMTKPAIDPKVLARLDTGLLKCLRKLGTPRQRICSALCISYAEYDDIVELLHSTK